MLINVGRYSFEIFIGACKDILVFFEQSSFVVAVERSGLPLNFISCGLITIPKFKSRI
jgi:hypothetical protein